MVSNPKTTILIKKKDGTRERILLSELQNRKKSIAPANNNVVLSAKKTTIIIDNKEKKANTAKKVTEKVDEKTEENPDKNLAAIVAYQPPEESDYFTEDEWDDDETETSEKDGEEEMLFENQEPPTLPALESEQHLAMTTPVVDTFVDQAVAKAWTPKDHQSLLEEEIVLKKEDQSILPENREESVSGVLASLPFQISKDLEGRLSSLIQSRLKDIRTDQQVLEYSEREIGSGGLSLSIEDAALLVSAIQKVFHVRPNIKVPKKEKIASSLLSNIKVPSHIVHEPIEPERDVDKESGNKQKNLIMHDVVAPPTLLEDQTISPIDELRNFSLADFRRLSSNVGQATEVLLNKFDQLKKESFSLFLKSGEAWRKSTLYELYATVLYESLSMNKTVGEVIQSRGSTDSISNEEFIAMANVGKILLA
ncbi:MAG: hypothetical protein COX81_03115 [Candidatus Magasanikbacteria bacterium CG_4_10_14_0_2_um_filter_37_12]|uniref:Uncharacterized protein n=1 Tax=Candidatus Magasanikbacteria bacterium CG_4_10_14_0_2_um_filter_37_12 TaxID=1974637 RepID=A0A2M7V7D6_9BACT|nr:MAG: hypothetical protein COX81_03115 [Candidatus Magasanikbacteria bacterium CG_4_10_14_0_2_um_filter_37_12]